MEQETRQGRLGGLSELAEDAVGFGGQELRLTRDLVLRPGKVMDAYDAHGSTAGGLYPKPLRYYLTLMGLYLLLIALLGGFGRVMSNPQTLPMWAALAERAGKTTDAFMADLDQWYSIFSVPVTALMVGGATFLLIRRWSPADDRSDFRQTFTFLNAYSVLAVPLGLLQLTWTSLQGWATAGMFVLLAVTYARVGRGRWWRTRRGAWGKGALLLLLNAVLLIPAGVLMFALSAAAAVFLP